MPKYESEEVLRLVQAKRRSRQAHRAEVKWGGAGQACRRVVTEVKELSVWTRREMRFA